MMNMVQKNICKSCSCLKAPHNVKLCPTVKNSLLLLPNLHYNVHTHPINPTTNAVAESHQRA
jgi:hypothetical protein